MKYFVDTNILIYAHDLKAGIKHERARLLLDQLWDSQQGVLSTQVLQELAVNLRGRVHPPRSTDEIRAVIHDYLSWEIFLNTPASILRALEIEKQYHLSFWDALLVQAAEGAGATTLYSEDLNHGQKYGLVRVVNPLRA
ncbi:MAG: PIN domain-containing protein [Terriglobales bacterium]|jgi:predicted nucleic acid-binding protein